jgi:glycosyltransferase involved in cell wall biosynthesis
MNNFKIKFKNEKRKTVVYLGFNDPKVTIRGTERVILNQALAIPGSHYYIYRGEDTKITKWGKLIAVSVPRSLIKSFIIINILLLKISNKKEILVHGHNYILSTLILCAPLVFTIHDSLAYLKKEMNENYIILYKLIEIFVYLKCKGIHCISNYSLINTWCYKIIKKKTSIIYNTTTINNKTRKNKETQIKSNKLNQFILIVRGIEDRANIDMIIEFAKLLKEKEPSQIINIVGKGPLLNHYRSLCKMENLDNISFLGYISDNDLIELYKLAKCIIVPAKYGEGFGLPVIEAYSMKKVVLASNVCALAEIIIDKNFLFENEKDLLKKYLSINIKDNEDIEDYFNNNFKSEVIVKEYKTYYDKFF